MARVIAAIERAGALASALARVVRALRRLALVGAAGVAAIALALARDGFSAEDGIASVLLLSGPAYVLLFAQGITGLAALPGRLRAIPGEGQERLAELGRIGAQARGARLRSVPLLLWRLRGTLGSLRDVAGVALPLRALTPPMLLLAALAALACLVLPGAGLVALLILAAG